MLRGVSSACWLQIFAMWITVGMGSSALAQEAMSRPFISNIELSVGVGVIDRGTTGIGAPLLGYGFDQAGGAVLELDARMFTEGWYRYVHHGLVLRGFHQHGRTLGLTDDATFRITGLDLAYGLRTLLPCISSDDMVFHLTPLVGLSALRANAGSQRLTADQTGQLTQAAHTAFDHTAFGGVIGLQFDVRHGPLLVALSGDLREHFAVGNTPVARNFMTSLTLRAGLDIDL